jgi:hypothetical protein
VDSESLARVNARAILYQDLAGLHDWLEGATYSMDGEQLAWLERCMAWLDKEVEHLRQ